MRNRDFKNVKAKVLSACLAGATAMSMMAPMAANAATITPTPEEVIPMEDIREVVSVAAHRAAETAPMILGANLTTTDGVKDPMLDVFGSDWNENANQLLYNYRILDYAKYLTETVDGKTVYTGITPTNTIALLSNRVGPSAPDLSGQSQATDPDIYLAAGYPSGLVSVPYDCENLTQMVSTMKNLAAAMEKVDKKHGLYEDEEGNNSPCDIAGDYEDYVVKTRDKVKAAIDSGTLKKKTVAIISTSSEEGKYTAFTEEYNIGTSINRAAEYVAPVTTNIVNVDGVTATPIAGKEGSYTISASALSKADYVITVGFQGSDITYGSAIYDELVEDYKAAGGTEEHIFAKLPESTYGIYMNSVENALGQAIMIMGVYGDQLKKSPDTTMHVDTTDAVAYFYRNFYHIDSSYVDDLANNFFGKNCFGYSGLVDDEATEEGQTVSDSFDAYNIFLHPELLQ